MQVMTLVCAYSDDSPRSQAAGSSGPPVGQWTEGRRLGTNDPGNQYPLLASKGSRRPASNWLGDAGTCGVSYSEERLNKLNNAMVC